MGITSTAARESACVFGTQCQLTGVLTEPSGARQDQLCALFLTSGLLHHIGPNRLHVELARSLARQGVAGLRFDFSGAGDSEPGMLGGAVRQRSVRELAEAMDYLQSHHGLQRFVLFGTGSGADDALASAQRDPRIVGAVLLDGPAFPAGRFRLYRALSYSLPRLLTSQQLRKHGKRLLRCLVTRRQEAVVDVTAIDAGRFISGDDAPIRGQAGNDHYHGPTKEETASILQSLCEAETDLLFVYTGSEHENYAYEGQLRDMFPALKNDPHVKERYLREADRALSLKEDREKLIRWIGDWCGQADFTRRCLETAADVQADQALNKGA